MLGWGSLCSVLFVCFWFIQVVICFLVVAIQTEEAKVKRSIKDAAKKGQMDVAKILAKEMVQSRKAVSKLYASKAHLNSVSMQMQQQLCE